MVNAPEITVRRSPATTNTLILVVPRLSSSSALFEALRSCFHSSGGLRLWAPLQGLGRVIAVFDDEQSAADAKFTLDRSVIEEQPAQSEDSSPIQSITLRVYNGPHTPDLLLEHPSLNAHTHLPVPISDKNFLISPPGSPPVGWEQIREDPPNAETLADDLMRALTSLGQVDRPDEPPQSSRVIEVVQPTFEDVVILDMGPDADVPTVRVSPSLTPNESSSGISLLNTPRGIRRSPTPRPPSDLSAVKATIESWQRNGNLEDFGSSNATRITPTARPPLDASN